MKKILVTGADGFLGSRLLARPGYTFTGLNRSQLDITDPDAVRNALALHQPDYVFHAAAISDTGTCRQNPEQSFAVNVLGAENVARGCAESGSKLIFCSSDQVYSGTPDSGPYREEAACPDTVYGNHKLEAENRILALLPSTVCLRLTWLFGMPERGLKTSSNLVWNALQAALTDAPMALSASEYRSLTYVHHLLDALEGILGLPGGAYNVGSRNDLSTRDAALFILTAMGASSRAERLAGIRPSPPRDLRMVTAKARAAGIELPDAQEGFLQCLKDSGYRIAAP